MKKLLKLTTKNGVFKLIAEDIKVSKAVFFVLTCITNIPKKRKIAKSLTLKYYLFRQFTL